MKTQDELKELKEEYESLTSKLKELTEDELMAVTGGFARYTDGFTVDEGAETLEGN